MTAEMLMAKPSLTAAEVDGELVMLDIDSEQYLGIRGVGVLIWRMLEQPVTEAAIVQAVIAAHDVAPERAREDVAAFLQQLREAGLLAQSGG